MLIFVKGYSSPSDSFVHAIMGFDYFFKTKIGLVLTNQEAQQANSMFTFCSWSDDVSNLPNFVSISLSAVTVDPPVSHWLCQQISISIFV